MMLMLDVVEMGAGRRFMQVIGKLIDDNTVSRPVGAYLLVAILYYPLLHPVLSLMINHYISF